MYERTRELRIQQFIIFPFRSLRLALMPVPLGQSLLNNQRRVDADQTESYFLVDAGGIALFPSYGFHRATKACTSQTAIVDVQEHKFSILGEPMHTIRPIPVRDSL